MTALQNHLSTLTNPDLASIEHTRDTLLSELTTPPEWTVTDTDVEIADDNTNDWLLATLQHEHDKTKTASIYLLSPAHTLQLYIESNTTDEWSDPTQTVENLEATLRQHS